MRLLWPSCPSQVSKGGLGPVVDLRAAVADLVRQLQDVAAVATRGRVAHLQQVLQVPRRFFELLAARFVGHLIPDTSLRSKDTCSASDWCTYGRKAHIGFTICVRNRAFE